MKKINT